MHVDGARIAIVVVAPGQLEQSFAVEHDARIAGERTQQLEFLGPQVDGPFANADLVPLGIDFQVAHLEHLGRRLTSGVAPQHGLHPRDQLAGVERLGHVIIGTQLEANDRRRAR